LANFIAEWTEIQEPILADRPEHWKMYFDGTLNIEGARRVYCSLLPPRMSSNMYSGFIF
jgi:hypothetical protein